MAQKSAGGTSCTYAAIVEGSGIGSKEKAIGFKQRKKGGKILLTAEAIIDAFVYQLSEAIHEMYRVIN